MLQNSPRQLVLSLLRSQALLAVIAAGLVLVFAGSRAALGVLAGGLIGVVLSLVFALRSFSLPAGASAQQMVAALYRGAAMKMLLAVILFVLVARFATPHFGMVMLGYSATLVAYWIAGLRSSVGRRHLDKGQ